MKKWLLSVLLLATMAGSIVMTAQNASSSSPVIGGEKNIGVNLAGKNLNFGASSIAPFRYADKLYFTAITPKGKDVPGTYTKIYTAMLNGEAQPMSINPKEEDMHAAHATLNVTATRIYYTLFKQNNLSVPGMSEICYREKQYDGAWGSIVKLPKHINKTSAFNSQPSCGYDAVLKKDVVFFVSNREGGKGGFDIWYCTVERNGDFGEPINLPTNTAADEMTPFFLSGSQVLFFSSNKRGGSGGMDVYAAAKMADGTWQSPSNLKAINTPFDEIYFNYHQPTKTCYFSSNRPNETCGNQPKGCRDYALFTGQLGQALELSTLNQTNNAALYGCSLQLKNRQTGQVEALVDKSEDNKFSLILFPNNTYQIMVSREGFEPATIDVKLSEVNFHQPVSKEITLKPIRY